MKSPNQMFGGIARDLETAKREREEMFARIERDQAEADARLDEPLTRRDVVNALEKVATDYGGNGNHDSDLIADAFRKLAQALQ